MELAFMVNIGDSFGESLFDGGECRMLDEGPSLGAKPCQEMDEEERGADDHDPHDRRNSDSSRCPIP